MKKVFALLRVSTSAQDLQRQKTDIERLRLTHGLTIERVIELEDVSGREVLSNAEVLKALDDLKRPDICGGAISALDRLFRPDDFSDFQILDYFRRSRKLIFSAKEGAVDPATDIGFQICLMSGAMAGMEWRTFRQRTIDGKREKRLLGRNVNGTATLPHGLRYQRITDNAGRTIDGKWSYDDAEVAKVAEAYRLLLQDRYSLLEIERRVGWGRGRTRTLANPAWRGVRGYTDERGTVEVPLPLKPLLTLEEWNRAQALLAKRRTWSWETRDQRHLGAGLLVCRCGRKYYIHPDARRHQHDIYFCASRYPRGKGCGTVSLWREIVDAAIIQVVEKHLTDAKFLAAAFRKLKQTPQADTRAEREQELAKLAGRRKRWMDAYDEERITKQEFNARMDKVNAAIHALEISMPATPPPVPDYRDVAAALVETLASFATLPFPDQRAALKRVVRSLPVVDDSFTCVAVSGAYLGELTHTKFAQPSRSRLAACRTDPPQR